MKRYPLYAITEYTITVAEFVEAWEDVYMPGYRVWKLILEYSALHSVEETKWEQTYASHFSFSPSQPRVRKHRLVRPEEPLKPTSESYFWAARRL